MSRFVSVCVFVWCSAVSAAWAQTDAVVQGRVTAMDHSPVTGAAIALQPAAGDRIAIVSDASGRFALSQVRPGDYTLTIAAPGFARSEMRLTLGPREVRAIVVALDVAPVAEAIRVTADGVDAATHSPGSTLLTAARLESMPASQRLSLPEALVTLAPGMIRGHDDFVHIRGHEVALNPMLNGVAFWENPHALFSPGISPDIIDTASVMTGGFPAEYGNRFGGVVDIVTKSGLSLRDRASVEVSGGAAGRRAGSGEIGGRRGGLAFYATGAYAQSDRFLSPPDPTALHDHGRATHIFGQLDWNAGHAGALRLIVSGDAADFEIPRTPLDLTMRPLGAAEQRTRQQTAIAGWTRAWSRGIASASAYQRWSGTRLLPASGPLTAVADVERELGTLGGKSDVTLDAGTHLVKVGLDAVSLRPEERLSYSYGGYRELTHLLGLPHIHVAGNAIAYTGDASGGQISAYAQDTVQIGSRTTVQAGVRVDRYGLVTTALHASPRASVSVLAWGGSRLHASYNRFFVPPPVEGVLSSGAGLTRTINEIGGALPALTPTIEDQVELGFTAPTRFASLGVTGYLRQSRNPVHTTVWPDSRIYSYASFDSAEAYGMDVKADLRGLAGLGVTGSLNYALGRVYFRNPVTGGFVTEAAHLTESNRFLGPMDQTHTLTGNAAYAHARSGFWMGTAIEYGSGTPIGHGGGEHEHATGEEHAHATTDAPARVPSHVTGSLSLGFDLLRRAERRPRLSLRVDVENVANRPYLIARDGEFSPTQYSVPRLVSATLRYRF